MKYSQIVTLKELLTMYGNRAYPQNKEILEQLMALRFELAQLIGFDNYAALVTADKMVGSPERVESWQSTYVTEKVRNEQFQVDSKKTASISTTTIPVTVS